MKKSFDPSAQLQTIANPTAVAPLGAETSKACKLSPKWLYMVMMLDDVLGS